MPMIKGIVSLCAHVVVCCVFARAYACVLMLSWEQPKLVVSNNVDFCCCCGYHKLCLIWLKNTFVCPPVTVPTHPLPI
jgi:hypothetical protein